MRPNVRPYTHNSFSRFRRWERWLRLVDSFTGFNSITFEAYSPNSGARRGSFQVPLSTSAARPRTAASAWSFVRKVPADRRLPSGAMNLACQRPDAVCRTPPPVIRFLVMCCLRPCYAGRRQKCRGAFWGTKRARVQPTVGEGRTSPGIQGLNGAFSEGMTGIEPA